MNADRAADMFIHYFALIAEKAGVPWDSDNAAEIRVAVDYLVDAAREVAREEVEKRVAALEAGTPQARQLQAELDVTLADNAAAGYGYDRHGRGCNCPYCPPDEAEVIS